MSLFEALGLKKAKASVGKPAGSAQAGAKPSAEQLAMMTEATQYAPLLQKAQADMAAWADPLAAAEKAKVQATVIDAARAKAKAGEYKVAMQMLGLLGNAVSAGKAALQKAQDLKALADAKNEVDPLVAQIGPLVPGITEPRLHKKIDADLTRLKADLDTASKLADVKAAAQAVRALKPRAERLKKDAQSAKDNSAWITTTYQKDVDATQSWINSVKSKNGKKTFQTVLKGLETEKDDFLDAGDAASVKTATHAKLIRLYHAAVDAADEGDKQDKVYKVHNLIDKVGALATPAVKQEIAALTALEKAGVPSGATVDAVEQSLKALKDRLAKLRKDVEGLRATDAGTHSDAKKVALEKTLALYKDAVDGIAEKTTKAAGVTKLEAMKKQLDAALALKDVSARGVALVRLDTEAHAELKQMKTHALQAQIAKSGTQGVDDMIKAMGASTDSDDNLTLCEAALQARFGVAVSMAEDLKKKSLPQLYTVLTKVPQWQSKQSKFQKLEIDNNRRGGDAYYDEGNYPGGKPTIALHDLPEGPGGSTLVPDVDPHTKTVRASYFDFTTLHEVGHAVDAKIKFMSQRMGKANAAFGGWEEPKTTDKVADYFGKEGGFFGRHTGGAKKATQADLKLLLVSFLDTKDADKPKSASAPMGSLIDQWADLLADPVIKACEVGMTIDDEAWEGGAATAAQIKVADRCFHNSYGGDTWVSYDYASRAPTGVSTYQWRAPGEWFAEIYALYYIGKLRDNHPLTKWFKESAVSEEAAMKPEAKADAKNAKAKTPAKAKG